MRALLFFLIAMTATAAPAFAQTTVHQHGPSASTASCPVPGGPRADPGVVALANQCRNLQLEAAQHPDDLALQKRCDDAAKALSGRTCSTGQVAATPCPLAGGPKVDIAMRARADDCRRIEAKLEQSPDDAALRKQCAEAHRIMTGHPCEHASAEGGSATAVG